MKTLVIGDIHFPFEDKKTLKIVSRFIEDYEPDNIVINGDLLDCYSLSSFAKDPRIGKKMSDEIKMAKRYLQHLNSISDAKKYLIFGNHEIRMNRFLVNKAPELIDLIDLETLLKTDGWDIINCSNIENYINIDNWYIGHYDRVSKNSSYTVKNIMTDKGVNIIQGHTHRLGAYYIRYMDRTLRGFEGGCLCSLNPVYTENPNWQQGLIVIENKNAYPIEIINHSFTWNNKTYKSD